MIDAHVHLWDPRRGHEWLHHAPAPLNRRFDANDLTAAAASSGTSGAVLVESGAGHDFATEDLLALAAGSPFVLGAVAPILLAADPTRTVAEALALKRAAWLVGFRDSSRGAPSSSMSPALDRVLSAHGLALEVMTDPESLSAAIALADGLPGSRIVIDHAAAPPKPDQTERWALWRDGIEELGRRAHVAVKISGVLTSTLGADELLAVGDVLLDSIGIERLMLGSDWPICITKGSYTDSMEAAFSVIGSVSAAESEQVRSGTAREVYGLLA